MILIRLVSEICRCYHAVDLGSGEEFGVRCMIFGVCYSVSDSEDEDTTVVVVV